MVEFTANIITIQNGARYQITIPVQLVKSKVIDPSKVYRFILEESEEKPMENDE